MTEAEGGREDPIREELRNLPRVKASASFNSRLLARAGDSKTQRMFTWPRFAVAGLVLLVVAASLVFGRQRSRRLEYQRQRAALEQRHDELRRELAQFRERAARTPRLYVGTGSDVDLVLDLEPWMQRPLDARPAAYAPSRP